MFSFFKKRPDHDLPQTESFIPKSTHETEEKLPIPKEHCAVSGISSTARGTIHPKERVTKMLDTVAHRGPDRIEVFEQSNDDAITAFGHARLAITGLSSIEGAKEMTFEKNGRSTMITFNGEIFNFKELRKTLTQKGYSFNTETDTEVLLKFLTEFGISAIEQIEGQFAFAFRDSDKKIIYLGRDRTGKKPLYYTLTETGDLIFASEPTAIAKDIGFAPDTTAIASLFLDGAAFAAGEEPLKHSIYKGIEQLGPGEFAEFDETTRTLQTTPYYHLPIRDITETEPDESYIHNLRIALEIAIRKRVPLEVETGCALSGGLDSSIVTAIAAQELQKHGRRLKTGTIRYTADSSNPDWDHAKMLADEHENIDFYTTDISPENFLAHLDEMVQVLGIQDSIRQMAMFENYRTLSEQGVKVVLVGEGADEFNWGYWHKFPGLKHDQETCNSAEGLQRLVNTRKNYVLQLFSPEQRKQLQETELTSELIDIYNSFDTTDPTRKMMGVYATIFLGFLNKANDRLSMYHGIEARVPFQDETVVSQCLTIPKDAQIKNDTEKHILREAFRTVLPNAIYERAKAPLPAAAHLDYHKIVAAEFEKRLHEVPENFWEIFDKITWLQISNVYSLRIAELELNHPNEPEIAGAELMKWRPIGEAIDILGDGTVPNADIRTNDVFKLLTTIVWYQQQTV